MEPDFLRLTLHEASYLKYLLVNEGTSTDPAFESFFSTIEEINCMKQKLNTILSTTASKPNKYDIAPSLSQEELKALVKTVLMLSYNKRIDIYEADSLLIKLGEDLGVI